jgi:ABC-type phosphate transport system substrate-binding protein
MLTRRNLLKALPRCALALALAYDARAGDDDIVVIVNKANPAASMTAVDLRPIFQTKNISWPHGEQAFPVNLPGTDPVRQQFDKAVLGLNADQVARYWIDRKIRGGARPPVHAPNAQAVLKAVAQTPGAVGYVREGEVNSSVKVVARIAAGELRAP